MAYNHGKKERKWRIWKEAEKKTMRDCGFFIYVENRKIILLKFLFDEKISK